MSTDFQIFHELSEVAPDFGPCALTIGNFDGVHAGHAQILRRVVTVAVERGWSPAVMTFDPHPLQVIAPARAPRVLTTPRQRCALMRSLGIAKVLVLPFTREVAAWSPEYFIRDVVVSKLQARAVLVGQDFRFGHRHAGNTTLLGELGKQLGFLVEIVPPVSFRGQRVSSSAIRSLVEAGNVSRACRLLGHPFALEGEVVRGHGIGAKQTVPTLNLVPIATLLPKTGVYVTRTRDLDSSRAWNSITNVGFRPTFSGDSLTVETFLLDGLESAPTVISVEFLLRLRDERKFESPEALKAQILLDVKRARSWFRRVS